jgi:transposase
MRGGDERSGSLFICVDLEAQVGRDRPPRTIRGIVNEALAALSGEFSALYSAMGRPSIPPEKRLRAAQLQAFYSIRSERQLEGDVAAKLLSPVLAQPRVKRLLSARVTSPSTAR